MISFLASLKGHHLPLKTMLVGLLLVAVPGGAACQEEAHFDLDVRLEPSVDTRLIPALLDPWTVSGAGSQMAASDLLESRLLVQREGTDREAYLWHGAVVGALVGLAVGTVVHFDDNDATCLGPDCRSDESASSVLTFGVLPVGGAALGAVVGWLIPKE